MEKVAFKMRTTESPLFETSHWSTRALILFKL